LKLPCSADSTHTYASSALKHPGTTATPSYLPIEFVRDSAFSFKPLEELVARIDGKRVVIEKS
jgi:hypothetical protein